MKNLQFKKSIITLWFLSYIFVLLIPVFISGFVYNRTMRVLRNEIKQSNTFMLRQIRQNVDRLLSDVNRLQVEVSFNSKVRELLSAKSLNDPYSLYVSHQVMSEFNRYVLSNPTVSNFYVYFNDIDRVLSHASTNSADEYYNIIYDGTNVNRKDWQMLIQSYNSPHYIPMEMKSANMTVNTISFISSVPITDFRNAQANLIIPIDKEKILELITQVADIREGFVFIIDQDNKILVSNSGHDWLQALTYNDLTPDSDSLYKSIGKEKYMIFHITSEVTGWKYVVAFPESMFWEKARYVGNITIWGMVACIVIGLVSIGLIVKRNYLPVRKLMGAFRLKQPYADNQVYEYDFIYSMIEKTMREKETISDRLLQQNTVLRSNFLLKLIKGTLSLEKKITIEELLETYEINFSGDTFAVILFYIESVGIFADEEKYTDGLKTAQFVITNIFDELINKNNNGYMTEIDEMVACLVNIKQESALWKQELAGLYEYAKEFIYENFEIQFSAGVSDEHKTLIGIPVAFGKALDALERRIVLGSDHIIVYDESVKMIEGNYYYPLEKEQQLINHIKTGDFESSKQALEEIFMNNFGHNSLSVQETKCLMFDLAGTIIKTANDINGAYGRQILEEEKFVDSLLKNDNIASMKEEITRIVKKFCLVLKAGDDANIGKNLRDRVLKYVNENYADINLSVSSIAQEFEVYQSYLSKIFKEQIGDGLLDYIHKVRISKAKLLLKDSEGNMESIALSTGYYSTRTFMRIFKKYEGITPGQYKEKVSR